MVLVDILALPDRCWRCGRLAWPIVGVLVPAGSWDIGVAKLAPNGTTAWSERIGGAQTDGNFAIATEGGRIALLGWAGSPLQLGSSVVPSSGGFLAMIQP